MKSIKYLAFIGITCLGLLSFTILVQEEWKVPAKYEKMVNPEDASKENIGIGKSLYSKHCKSCHGKEGHGDGAKANRISGNQSNFSKNEFQAQSDGSLFYKIYFGRNDMPSHEKKMSDEDIWFVILYVRTLAI